MKEIVVISGKGGTGKTSISASLAFMAGKNAVLADCDVDAADMHLILKPDIFYKEDFYSGYFSQKDIEQCVSCGKCQDVCRFNAVEFNNGKYKVNKNVCEGCGHCLHVCSTMAIELKDRLTGNLYVSNTRLQSILVHAELSIGAENSGKLVTKVKREAEQIAILEGKEYIICDGSPGIGCPVIASVNGAEYIVVVTEPTVSGIHDLKRIMKLIKGFETPVGCIINKFDLNNKVSSDIRNYLLGNEIELLCELPYNNVFTEAIKKGNTINEQDGNGLVTKGLLNSWRKIKC